MTTTRREFLKMTGITGLAFSLPVYSEIFGHLPLEDEVKVEVQLIDCTTEQFLLNLDDCAQFSHDSDHGMQIMEARGLTEPPPVVKTFIRESLQAEVIIVGDMQDRVEMLEKSFLHQCNLLIALPFLLPQKQIRIICDRWKKDRSGIIVDVSFNRNIVEALRPNKLADVSTDLSLNINLLQE